MFKIIFKNRKGILGSSKGIWPVKKLSGRELAWLSA